jgi:hypothetical protein
MNLGRAFFQRVKTPRLHYRFHAHSHIQETSAVRPQLSHPLGTDQVRRLTFIIYWQIGAAL